MIVKDAAVALIGLGIILWIVFKYCKAVGIVGSIFTAGLLVIMFFVLSSLWIEIENQPINVAKRNKDQQEQIMRDKRAEQAKQDYAKRYWEVFPNSERYDAPPRPSNLPRN